ncbi:NAD(P)H-hydrate dehydratase [Thalassotalea maritima]|uniref:NAD(P)H-hydrate dehydratase n=1 Tax=Thalassotalea maritima TaxID=3242416 RepID=UPI0035278960
MLPVKLSDSLPQVAYLSETVVDNEARFAAKLSITMQELMNLAGLSAFKLLQYRYPKAKTILIIAGSGNNAGDGFVLARCALAQGYHVYVHAVQPLDQYQGDAHIACQQFLKQGGSLCKINDVDFKRVDVIVDALLGTGFRGKVKDTYGYLINLVNQLDIPILSLDVPSGVDANCGVKRGSAIVADATVTFVAVKQGLLTGEASNYCGELYLADLHAGHELSQELAGDAQVIQPKTLAKLKQRTRACHKGDTGMLLALGSDALTPGAIALSSMAALRAGAGYVVIDCHPQNQAIIAGRQAEFVFTSVVDATERDHTLLSKANAIVIGPGLGIGDFAQLRWHYTLDTDLPLVVDADALTLLAKQPSRRDNWILTPHPKEAARLLSVSVDEVNADRFSAARAISDMYGGICVLKGAGTIVTDGQQVHICPIGNPGMAVAGMGDVLTGIIGALLLQSSSLIDAALNAVYIHAHAADLAARDGEKGLLPSDLYPFIRQLVNQR